MKACTVCVGIADLVFYGGTCSKECARTKYLGQELGWLIETIRKQAPNG